MEDEDRWESLEVDLLGRLDSDASAGDKVGKRFGESEVGESVFDRADVVGLRGIGVSWTRKRASEGTDLDVELETLVRFERDRVLLSRAAQDRSQLSAKDLRDGRLARLRLRAPSAPLPLHTRNKKLTVLVVAVRPFEPTSSHSSVAPAPLLFPSSSGILPLSTRSIMTKISSWSVSRKKPKNSSASSWCPRRIASKRLLGLIDSYTCSGTKGSDQSEAVGGGMKASGGGREEREREDDLERCRTTEIVLGERNSSRKRILCERCGVSELFASNEKGEKRTSHPCSAFAHPNLPWSPSQPVRPSSKTASNTRGPGGSRSQSTCCHC